VTEELVDRLDRVIAILQLAHGDAIERARTKIRSDKVNAAILDASAQWVGTATLQSTVMKKAGAKERTVQMRVVDLLAQGVIEKKGGGKNIEYKATGLV
jgi:Tfp pilus assembly protein FimT